MNQQFSVGDKVRVVCDTHEYPNVRNNAMPKGSEGVVTKIKDGYVEVDGRWVFISGELELINVPILRQSTVFNTDVLTVGSAVRIIGHSVEIEGETVEPSEDFECGVNGLISSVSSDKTRVVYIDPYGNQQVEYISIDEVINGLYTIELLK